jgi:hypothetical protein
MHNQLFSTNFNIFFHGIAIVVSNNGKNSRMSKETTMKRLLILILAVFAMGSKSAAQPTDFRDHTGYSSYDPEGRFGFFYSSLSPYGEWVDCNFGYAWRPYRVGHAWRPYLNGRWIWTSYGWYWASNEPFGWATFHYGRWTYDDYYGWIWIPDDVWGPSWVEWRYDNDYIGWAPLSPYAGFNINVGITFSNGWNAPIHYWNFVPCRNFTSTRVYDYVQPVERSRRIFGNTRRTIDIRSENDRVINRGIDVGFVERRGNMRIDRVDVIDNNRGSGDKITRENNRERIEVFRPRLDTRTGDVPQHRDNVRPDRSRGYENKEADHSNRELRERGVYDRQQPRIPSGENKQSDRQYRDNRQDEQRRDAIKRNDQNRGNWIQQQQQQHERRSEVDTQKPQREQRSDGKNVEKPQQRSREREQKDQRTTGRGRRP